MELGAFLRRLIGAYELPQAGSALTGRLLFLHRLSGGRELRKRVRPDWAAPFPAPTVRGARTASAGSPFPGGEFSAEPQRGDSPPLRRERAAPRGGDDAVPTAVGKKEGQPTVFLPL